MDLLPGETIVSDQSANWMKGPLAIGGRLVVTDRRVLFIPYKKFNKSTVPLIIDIQDIANVDYSNSFLFIPNGIIITVVSGEKYKFVVWFRRRFLLSMYQSQLTPLTSE